MFGGFTSLGLATTRFACRRSPGAAPECVLTRSAPLARVDRYPPGSIGAVEVFERSGEKKNSAHYFDVTLLDRRGAEAKLVSYRDPVLADTERDRVRQFLADPSALSFVKELEPGARDYAAFVAALAFSLGVMLLAFVDAGKIRVSIDRSRARLDVRRTLFGLPIRRAYSFPLGCEKRRPRLPARPPRRARLPGAEMSAPLEPGSYTIDVFDPDVPGSYQTQRFDITVGQTTTVHCRPVPR